MLEKKGPIYDDSRRIEMVKKLGVPINTTWAQMRSYIELKIEKRNTGEYRKELVAELGLPENTTFSEIKLHLLKKAT